jgi:hypothetical protein
VSRANVDDWQSVFHTFSSVPVSDPLQSILYGSFGLAYWRPCPLEERSCPPSRLPPTWSPVPIPTPVRDLTLYKQQCLSDEEEWNAVGKIRESDWSFDLVGVMAVAIQSPFNSPLLIIFISNNRAYVNFNYPRAQV